MGGLLSVLLLGEPVTALHHSLCHHDHRLLDSSKIALLITFFKKNFLDFCLHTYIFSVSNCKSTKLQKFCIHFPYIPLHCFGLFCKQIRKQRHINGPNGVQSTYKIVQQTGVSGLSRPVSFTQNESRLWRKGLPFAKKGLPFEQNKVPFVRKTLLFFQISVGECRESVCKKFVISFIISCLQRKCRCVGKNQKFFFESEGQVFDSSRNKCRYKPLIIWEQESLIHLCRESEEYRVGRASAMSCW